MNPGDTFFGFDKRGHLWIVLTQEDADGDVAVANFTTHEVGLRPNCSSDCFVVQPGEHPYPRHDSCIPFWRAMLTSNARLEQGVIEGVYEQQAPLTPELLQRVRMGALTSEASQPVKAAIRRDLQ